MTRYYRNTVYYPKFLIFNLISDTMISIFFVIDTSKKRHENEKLIQFLSFAFLTDIQNVPFFDTF